MGIRHILLGQSKLLAQQAPDLLVQLTNATHMLTDRWHDVGISTVFEAIRENGERTARVSLPSGNRYQLVVVHEDANHDLRSWRCEPVIEHCSNPDVPDGQIPMLHVVPQRFDCAIVNVGSLQRT